MKRPALSIVSIGCRREHDEGMEDWDQAELEKAVAEKHAAEKGPQKTDIICKFFLDAVERKQYGWCALSPWLQRTIESGNV